MVNNENISLSREEWEAFDRRINTPNPERAHRAEAFLHEYDEIVSVRREGTRTEIDIPWIEESELLALLGVKESKPKIVSAQMQSEDYWDSSQMDFQAQEIYTNLNVREITAEGLYMYMQTKAFSKGLRANADREFSGSIYDNSLLLCA